MVDRDFFVEQTAHYAEKVDDFSGRFFDTAPDLLKLMNRFMIEADNGLPGSDAVLTGIGIEICHFIIRCMVDLSPVRDRITKRIEIDRVVEYLHANLEKKITVETMAEVACMSPSHFAHTFREETGAAPAAYLREMRLQTLSLRLRTKKRIKLNFESIRQYSESFVPFPFL